MKVGDVRGCEDGIALPAVLFALMLLALLALPFSVSMGVGAEAASHDVDQTAVEQASASARDILLADAAASHPALDATPTYDDRLEWPDHVELPAKFAPLREDGRVLLGGEVWDLQRFLSLDTVSPIVLGNLLGTTTRLREDFAKGATTMALDNADALPDAGFVWVAHEIVRYGGKQGNNLVDVTRGMFWHEMGMADGTATIAAQSLVLDYRCVAATAWPFTGRSRDTRATRRPYSGVGELVEIAGLGIGTFTPDELDTLRGTLSADTLATTAATWGRPERVFDKLDGESVDIVKRSRVVRVRSALHVGAGSTVRIRNLRTGTLEYGLVMATGSDREAVTLATPLFRLELYQPVLHDYPAFDTVVEPLIPIPINVNTASAEVLTAVLADLRRGAELFVHDADGQRRTTPPLALSRSQARELADEIVARRGGDAAVAGNGPFTGWQDFVERLLKPKFEAASANPQKQLWLTVYRNLQTGRDSTAEMGTAPICFQSGPWVGYRAAAARSRSAVAPGIAARHERTGLAAAVPGYTLEHTWNTQEVFEDAFQLDRRSPFWVTTPVNLGALQAGESNDPAPRYFPHVVPLAYPGLGFGSPRYASRDPADASITPAAATVRYGNWPTSAVQYLSFEGFAQAPDPRGHDVKKDGPFAMQNTGPRGGAAAAPPAAGGRHDGISFPFANNDGFANRFATSFWVQAQSLANVVLFDHNDGDPNRNRFAVRTVDDRLLFEVIDEAGIDPDPSTSPAGVTRTATEWSLPLAELALPADTPLHLSVSAYGSRPSELAVAVDGMTRGKTKYVTYLTTAIKSFDPTLGNNQTLPGAQGNDRYLDIEVESTEGFPPVGVLRIGTEIYEYSSIRGNSFQCRWKDSLGGRGARMIAREYRPDIPLDAAGEPTVDIDALKAQGVNLDFFPGHPVNSMVELYGYSTQLAENSPMMVGTTKLDGAIGGFAVARGFVTNPRPIAITPQSGPPIQIGVGLDETWTGDLELADPVPSGNTYPPNAAQQQIAAAFSATGGYALLVQVSQDFTSNVQGQLSATTPVGGVELIRYTSRQGTKLNGVQRAQTLPGDDTQIASDHYKAATAARFVTKFRDDFVVDNGQTLFNDVPTFILWVVPVSLSLQSTQTLWDPAQTKLTEWLQIYPKSGDPDDTEWVRYDAIANNKYVARGNRAAWDRARFVLTQAVRRQTVQVGPLGPSGATSSATPPWGAPTVTADYIGYVPKLEADFPQIHAARQALQFRGDPFTETSSHAHDNAIVMQCQRLELSWGNFGAFTGRCGRNDRVALVQGSVATGAQRPAVEWHTVNWACRRFNSDNLAKDKRPPELLGPWPFQLVAFQDGVQGAFVGPPRGPRELEPRRYDRVVKFPSGELPAAYCENVMLGASVTKAQPITGFVDEVEVRSQPCSDLVIEEACTADAKTIRVARNMTYNPNGPVYVTNDLTVDYPKTGGLLAIDGEIVAYQGHADGVITIATNGRGLLNTQARDHDRGARVHFLAHRPAAITTGGIGAREATMPVQALGALPANYGTVLLGREVLHYAWVQRKGDQASLDMPKWFPPGEDAASSQARGLFRGRFGTTAQAASTGEALIAWPFRYWDRNADRSDDPELAYSQLTTTEAPALYRALRWREETSDPRVDVVCFVRTDSKAPWSSEPGAATPGFWRFEKNADNDEGQKIDAPGSRLEIRFVCVYKPGVLDLVAFRAHGWKTTVRVRDVRLEYEGQPRIFDERVTAR